MMISFNLENDEFKLLRLVAERDQVDINGCAKKILCRYLSKYADVCGGDEDIEQRSDPRAKVSISGVSCVNISDKEFRSFPVVVEDISKGGMKISFKQDSSELLRHLSDISSFEVVFTIPKRSQIVSLSCKCLRHYINESIFMAGAFEGNDETAISMIDSMVKDAVWH